MRRWPNKPDRGQPRPALGLVGTCAGNAASFDDSILQEIPRMRTHAIQASRPSVADSSAEVTAKQERYYSFLTILQILDVITVTASATSSSALLRRRSLTI